MIWKIKHTVFFFFPLIAQVSAAQPGSHVWADSCVISSFFGQVVSVKRSNFIEIKSCPNGDLIGVGEFSDTGILVAGFKGYGHIMRLNRQGNLIWSKFLGFTMPDASSFIRSITATTTRNGDIAVQLDIVYEGQMGHFALRLNQDGEMIWCKRLPFLSTAFQSDIITKIVETADDGFLLAGKATAEGILIKLDAAGNLIWHTTFTSPTNQYFVDDVVETPSGYYVNGIRTFPSPYAFKNFIAKVTPSNGQVEWVKAFDFPNFNQVTGHPEFTLNHITYQNGTITLCGGNYAVDLSASIASQLYVTMNENGDPLSATQVKGPAVQLSPFLTFVGSSYDPATRTGVQWDLGDSSDCYVYRLNENNTKKWAWRMPWPNAQNVSDFKVLDDTSVVMAGSTVLPIQGAGGLIIKTASSGRLENCMNQDRNVTSNPVAVALFENAAVEHSTGNTLATADAIVDIIDGSGFDWELQCSTVAVTRLGKIDGKNQLCTNTAAAYSIARGGNYSFPVAYSSNGPAVIISSSDSTASVRFTADGTFTLYAKMNTSCGDLVDSIIVTVNRGAEILSLGDDTSICRDNSIVLQAPGNFIDYVWQDNSTANTFLVREPGTYILKTMDLCNRAFTDTILVNPAPPVNFSIGPDRMKCNSDTLQLDVPAGFAKYQWSPSYQISNANQHRVVINPLVDTNYIVTAERYPGCLLFDTVQITVHQSPPINAGRDTNLCKEGETIQLNAGNDYQRYSWNNGTSEAVNIVQLPGLYIVTGYTANGCRYTDSVNITNAGCFGDVNFPTAFAPASVSGNNLFKPVAGQMPQYYKLQVFNRWGQTVFQSNNVSGGWDGKLLGKEQDKGSYIWMCEYLFSGNIKRYKRGTVTLIR